MGSRILLSGSQIGMTIGSINTAITTLQYVVNNKLIDYPNIPGMGNPAIALQNLKHIKKDLEESLETNYIEQSEDPLEDDVLLYKNISASWKSRTE